LPGGSKIAPHSVGLLAERSVLSFQFVKGHETLFYQSRQIEHMPALTEVTAPGFTRWPRTRPARLFTLIQ
jgi:hypothetical protein